MESRFFSAARRLITYFKLQEEVPERDESRLLWSRIERDVRRKKRNRKIIAGSWSAAAAVVVAVLCFSLPRNERQSTESGLMAELVVPMGEHMSLELADGSSLRLNSGTRVIYPRSFDNSPEREIYVDGEIFIDVQPDAEHPFIVRTAGFEVEVLGTAFNVNAYSEDSHAEVTLVRGSVRITDRAERIMQLEPDQQAVLNDGGLSEKRSVDARKYVSWTDGVMIFEGEALENVMDRLERYYGVNIIREDSIKISITGSLDLNDSLAEVLERISVIAPIRVSRNEDGYHVYSR